MEITGVLFQNRFIFISYMLWAHEQKKDVVVI